MYTFETASDCSCRLISSSFLLLLVLCVSSVKDDGVSVQQFRDGVVSTTLQYELKAHLY